jgi:hypothetical protein
MIEFIQCAQQQIDARQRRMDSSVVIQDCGSDPDSSSCPKGCCTSVSACTVTQKKNRPHKDL